ncbi:nitroreductase family protein [Nocardioides panacisoli]|uniref:nitroreductase family protein n=1 Tax=Nocardioides panacisoli TaxID=627624 RepID=UPI001C6355DE|nr:nitroreductase family protein [Nocardioides panacisoli]QYJ03214.1 nitroreductase family protein [Nocardioides panacisoli]
MAHAPQPGAEVLAEPMRSRWSPSVYDGDHQLEPDQIRTLLTAAQWSPSAGNAQPWRFFVAERGDTTHKVLVPHLTEGNSWVPYASVVFLTCAKIDSFGRDDWGDETYGCYDLGQAAAHLTLQARAMDLHAHQFMGFDREAVAEELGLPDHFRMVSGIAVGVRGNVADASERIRGKEEKERKRRPLADTAFSRTWGEAWHGVSEQ